MTSDTLTLPNVRKTEQMQEIENAHEGRDIRLVLKDLYERLGSQAAVADALELEQSTVSIWAARLGMVFTSKPVVEFLYLAPAQADGSNGEVSK